MWNNSIFENWFTATLYSVAGDLGLDGYIFEVYNEQDFIKKGTMKPKTINVVIKYLSGNKDYASYIQPIQILIMAEENTLQASNIIFSKLYALYNWHQYSDGDLRVKMQFSNPVVLNNFNIVGHGYRSILYVSTTLYILENVYDISVTDGLTIDNNKLDYITFNISYSMSGDTKPFPNEYFARTVRSVQTFVLTLVVPCVECEFLEKVFKISNGSEDGNADFNFEFSIGGISFQNNYKLISVVFVTQPNSVPSVQLGFML